MALATKSSTDTLRCRNRRQAGGRLAVKVSSLLSAELVS